MRRNPEPPRAPFNQFVHYREFPDAENKAIVGFNVDTLYSLAQLDLSGEPMVLSVPETGNRWWLMQLLDAWNDVFAAPGTRTLGGLGGDFAITGPHWKGKLPAGMKEYRSDTSLAMIGGRTYTAGKNEYSECPQNPGWVQADPLVEMGPGILAAQKRAGQARSRCQNPRAEADSRPVSGSLLQSAQRDAGG